MRSCTRWTLTVAAGIAILGLTAGVSAARPTVAEKVAGLSRPLSLPEALPPPENDRCEGAILVPCGNIALSGHTALATNDYTITDTLFSCTGFSSNGLDVVYRFDANVGDSLWINYTSSADGSIYMVTNCNDIDGTCVAGSDSALAGVAESISYKFTTAGTYYLILDSFGPETSGSWTANGQMLCGSTPPPANDICANAPTLSCGVFSFSGNTQFASNDYTFPDPGSSCFGQVANGADVVYRLDIEAGDSLTVDYFSHANGSIYVVGDCSDPVESCVVGADAVGTFATEKIRHRFLFTGIYYLILDSQDPGSSGEWSAIGSLVCTNPPPDNDRCDNALPITCGSISLAGSTALATNDYFVTGASVSCTNFAVDGNDVVYQLFVRNGYHLSLESLSSVDGAVYIVTDCDSVLGSRCLVGEDSGLEGEPELVEYTFTYDGIAYLIFDAFDLNSGGNWTANGTLSCVSVGVDPGQPSVLDLAIGEAFPNPFRERTTLRYSLPGAGPARIGIYDLQGRVVQTLVDRDHPAGRYHATWDGRDETGRRVGPGVYFAKLTSNGRDAVRRMIFVE